MSGHSSGLVGTTVGGSLCAESVWGVFIKWDSDTRLLSVPPDSSTTEQQATLRIPTDTNPFTLHVAVDLVH